MFSFLNNLKSKCLKPFYNETNMIDKVEEILNQIKDDEAFELVYDKIMGVAKEYETLNNKYKKLETEVQYLKSSTMEPRKINGTAYKYELPAATWATYSTVNEIPSSWTQYVSSSSSASDYNETIARLYNRMYVDTSNGTLTTNSVDRTARAVTFR